MLHTPSHVVTSSLQPRCTACGDPLEARARPENRKRDHITEAEAAHGRPRAGSPTSAGQNGPAAHRDPRTTQNLLPPLFTG